MATKRELYDHLAKLQAENHRLRGENEAFRTLLLNFYQMTRRALGIEYAIAERERAAARQRGS